MADTSFATRGDLASALFSALGLTAPTSTGKFSDAGTLDGVASTLMDLGITTGIGPNTFGTGEQTTRGQAFTMIARALGLADASTPIEEASRRLVQAGIVQGYGNDPNNIGINDPLQLDHLGLLMGRLGPELSRPSGSGEGTVGEVLLSRADDARDTNMARTNPAWSAFLQTQGIRLADIEDEVALRQELFAEDARRRTEAYQRATESSLEGIGTDFENRGLFRSGTRVQAETDRSTELGFQQEADQYAAQRAHGELMRTLGQQQNAINQETSQRRIEESVGDAEEEIQGSI